MSNSNSVTITAAGIAELVQGKVIGDSSIKLTGFAPADSAGTGDITFAEKEVHFRAAEQSQASAILVPQEFAASKKVLICVRNTRVAMARVLPLFFPPDQKKRSGIHSSAVIDASSQIDSSAYIGPNCVVGANVKLGAHSVLMGGNHIAANCMIGDEVCLYPNVVLYSGTQIGHRVSIHAGSVIGSDGYGYVFDEGRHRKVLQVGKVMIHDDVEIGANSAIDRAALGATVIGQGTKIDNLVHIAHNVVIGRHCLIMGQVGFAGSTQLGDYCVIASQSGIAGHLKFGNQVTVGGKSGVMKDIPDGSTVLGSPAVPDKQCKRQFIAIQKLPEMIHRLRELEKEVKQLKARIGEE
jgi:UDP-3-O-[3-hydroxymyristoyl] glucosamine N-acyltransferase